MGKKPPSADKPAGHPASGISEKTLNWLFENATKVAPVPAPETPAE